jgi:hypothetical protein
MNTMTANRRSERLTRLGILQAPLGYVDGGDVYEYVRCSPVGGVDPMGLAAWKHTHWWDDSWKQKYRQFVQDHAIDYVTSQEDCASLTLLVLRQCEKINVPIRHSLLTVLRLAEDLKLRWLSLHTA